ncbi:MAG: rRNA pseudouridine synthase [Clostridia bacterium]|nr:rRNA pseudouridine synthase [Clostridia bacterium]
MEKIRLDKILSKSGFGSRTDSKKLIRAGRVAVNGKKALSSSEKAYPENVTVDGKKVEYKEFVYIILNKPAGVISATEDRKKETVLDLLPECYNNYDLFPVGRLDIDTEGFLLITNDGPLAHNLLSPNKHCPKTYYAETIRKPDETEMQKLREGVYIGEGVTTTPAEAEYFKNGILLTIYEGKFHQVKRMLEAVDNKVTYLKRLSMGNMKLPEGLETGEYVEVDLSFVQNA